MKKQINILEQRLKTIADTKKIEQENKVLQNQVKQLKETGLALKKRIKELAINNPMNVKDTKVNSENIAPINQEKKEI